MSSAADIPSRSLEEYGDETFPAVEEDSRDTSLLAMVYYREKVVEITHPSITLGDVCEALGIPLEKGTGVRDRQTGQVVATLSYDRIVRHQKKGEPFSTPTVESSKEGTEGIENRRKHQTMRKARKNEKTARLSSSSSYTDYFSPRTILPADGVDPAPTVSVDASNTPDAHRSTREMLESEEEEEEEDVEDVEEEEEENRVEMYELFRDSNEEAGKEKTQEKLSSPTALQKEGDDETALLASDRNIENPSHSSSALPSASLLQHLVKMGMTELFFPLSLQKREREAEVYQPQRQPFFLSNTVYPPSVYSPHRPVLVSSFSTKEEKPSSNALMNHVLVAVKKEEDGDVEEKDELPQEWKDEVWSAACGYRSGVETYRIPPTPCVDEWNVSIT